MSDAGENIPDSRPARELRAVQEIIGGRLRKSRRGVPHLVVEAGGGTHSLCYFGRSGLFRAFTPYPSRGVRQARRDLTRDEVVEAFSPS